MPVRGIATRLTGIAASVRRAGAALTEAGRPRVGRCIPEPGTRRGRLVGDDDGSR